METENLIITDKQAHQIAFCIYLDISNYIKEHQKEYEKWLELNQNLKKE
jgi:hypothetical protein